jgi:hypothetical protein
MSVQKAVIYKAQAHRSDVFCAVKTSAIVLLPNHGKTHLGMLTIVSRNRDSYCWQNRRCGDIELYSYSAFPGCTRRDADGLP